MTANVSVISTLFTAEQKIKVDRIAKSTFYPLESRF